MEGTYGVCRLSPVHPCYLLLTVPKVICKNNSASTSNNNHLFTKTLNRLCQNPTSDQELLLGEADVHGMLRSHFESLQGILGVSGLSIRLKLYKGNVTASRHQTHLLEPREPVSGGGAAQIQGEGEKGTLHQRNVSVALHRIDVGAKTCSYIEVRTPITNTNAGEREGGSEGVTLHETIECPMRWYVVCLSTNWTSDSSKIQAYRHPCRGDLSHIS